MGGTLAPAMNHIRTFCSTKFGMENEHASTLLIGSHIPLRRQLRYSYGDTTASVLSYLLESERNKVVPDADGVRHIISFYSILKGKEQSWTVSDGLMVLDCS